MIDSIDYGFFLFSMVALMFAWWWFIAVLWVECRNRTPIVRETDGHVRTVRYRRG